MTHERAQVLVEPLARAVLDGVHEFEGEPERVRVDLGLFPVFADERPLQGLAGLMDWRRSGRISSLLRSGFCTGAAGERVLLPGSAGLPVERVVLVGLGLRADFDAEVADRIARDLVATATGLAAARVLVALPSHAERRQAELLFAALTVAIEQADRDHEARLALAEPSIVEVDPVESPNTAPAAIAEASETAPSEQDLSVASDSAASAGPTEPSDPSNSRIDSAPEGQPEPGPGAPAEAALERETEPTTRPDPAPIPDPPTFWWVVAEERVVARLRRVLSGPPRATSGGLHT